MTVRTMRSYISVPLMMLGNRYLFKVLGIYTYLYFTLVMQFFPFRNLTDLKLVPHYMCIARLSVNRLAAVAFLVWFPSP